MQSSTVLVILPKAEIFALVAKVGGHCYICVYKV